ncbi:MAG: hypothetical protein OXE57_14720 [Alphaproteobacteria bacterium]|nr:hypothetical protein [Alphaproteobacteria bacterium]
MTTEQEAPVKRRRQAAAPSGPQPAWPGDPEHVEAGGVDFEAVAHVLANTCRWGGRTRRFLSIAQHALTVSEEIGALEGIADGDCRALALHALLADARAAWPGEAEGAGATPARAAAQAKTPGGRIDRAVREAAGLDPEPPEEWAEVLRFVARMADAAERRDLVVGAGGLPFPPLRRAIRPMAPEAAAERWLARLRELGANAGTGGGSAVPAGAERAS